MDRLKRFGERLKEARRAKGLTQVGLAHALNSDPTHISRWERGKIQPSHESLEALANALERAPSWLLDYDDSSVDEPTAGRELTIDAIEQEWRDDGVFPEAIRLWRTRIEHATSSHTKPKITEAVRERDRIQGMIDAKMLTREDCIRIMQSDIGDAKPTPPPYDPDDPGPPKKRAKK